MKRIQIQFTGPALEKLESILQSANEEFAEGNVILADVVNQLVMNGRPDVQELRIQRTSWKRLLQNVAANNADIDTAIKQLSDLRKQRNHTGSKRNRDDASNDGN